MNHPTLESARTALLKFEKSRNELVGREALAEGLAELIELRATSMDTKLHTVCGNLIDTYRNMVEDEVTHLLDDKTACVRGVLLHWREVMGEFEYQEMPIPERFRAIRSQLIVQIVYKEVEQLSSADRQSLLRMLEKHANDAICTPPLLGSNPSLPPLVR